MTAGWEESYLWELCVYIEVLLICGSSFRIVKGELTHLFLCGQIISLVLQPVLSFVNIDPRFLLMFLRYIFFYPFTFNQHIFYVLYIFICV